MSTLLVGTPEWSRKIGVHVSHCCWMHGCKYGDPECPVESGAWAQGYPCEACDILEAESDARELNAFRDQAFRSGIAWAVDWLRKQSPNYPGFICNNLSADLEAAAREDRTK